MRSAWESWTASSSEGVQDCGSRDGGVGVADIDEVVDDVGVTFGVDLHAMGGDVGARWGRAVLATLLHVAAAVAGDSAGDAASNVAANHNMAAEGAYGFDLVNCGRVGSIVQLFELSGCGFGGEEGAVGCGD